MIIRTDVLVETLQDLGLRLFGVFQTACCGFIMVTQVRKFGGCIQGGALVVVVTSLNISIFVVPFSFGELCNLPLLQSHTVTTSCVTSFYLVL